MGDFSKEVVAFQIGDMVTMVQGQWCMDNGRWLYDSASCFSEPEDQGQLLKKHVAQPAPVEEPQDAGTKGQEEELSSSEKPHRTMPTQERPSPDTPEQT